MSVSLDNLLLGSLLTLDLFALLSTAVVIVLFAALRSSSAQSLSVAKGARIAFAFAVIGALMQTLAGELLLFLAGGTLLGFAMLSLGLTGPRTVLRVHAKSIAVLLVLSDLALLELTMLLGKSVPDVSYTNATTAFGEMREHTLLTLCFVVGFGIRCALPVVSLAAYRRSKASIALLPGWFIVALCSGVGVLRLGCTRFPEDCREPSLASLLAWTPLLAALLVLIWQLPRCIPALQSAFLFAGSGAKKWVSVALQPWKRVAKTIANAPRVLRQAEARLTDWPVAMGALLLLIVVVPVVLF